MEEIEKLIAKNSFVDDSIHLVEVTHALDPSNFYVRPMKYKPIIKVLESMRPKSRLTSFNIQDMVIFNLSYLCGGWKYLRGRITAISRVENHLTCDVFAIDYGFKKIIPIENIWECPRKLATKPAMAYNCQLANCYPTGSEGFSSDTINAFKHYVELEPLKMTVLGRKPNKNLIELKNSAKESIASLLAMKGYATIRHNIDLKSWKHFFGNNRKYFNFKELTIDEKLHVRVLSGNSLNEFYVARVSDYKKHHEEIDIITAYARREFALSPIHLVVGTLVCVKIEKENKYERAFITKVTKPNESAIVTLVDLGRREEVHVGKMKYMPSRCLETPVLSIYCKSEENQAWNNGLDRFLHPGFEFNITIKCLGHEFECPNKVDISALVSDDGQDEARA